ncbi:MAG: hypothetical protein QXI18_01650 [Nitrososphaerota archaeon]
MGISLLDAEKEKEIKRIIGEIADPEEAIEKMLELHEKPLTYGDIRRLLSDRSINPRTLTRCLKKLLGQGRIQKMIYVLPWEAVYAYAPPSDTRILVAIDLALLRKLGYRVLIGVKVEGQGEGYPLMEVEGDALLIHIDRSEYRGHSILTTEKGNFVIYTPRLKEEVNGDLHEHNGQEV